MPLSRLSRTPQADFTNQVGPHLPRLRKLSLRLTRGRAGDASDLVQESLARVWALWDRMHPGTKVAPYLARTILHTYLSQERHRRVVQREHAQNDMIEHLMDPGRRMAAAQPEGHWCARDLSPPVRRALATLPHHYREPLILVDLHDYAYREAAEHLGIPLGTVMSRLHRARRQLRSQLRRSHSMGLADLDLAAA